MNLQQLIDELQNLIETGECTGDEPVLFAHQPNYPLQCSINGPHVVDDGAEDLEEARLHLEMARDDEEDPDEIAELDRQIAEAEERSTKIVYLAEGGWRPRRADGSEMSPYAPRAAWGEG